ncbi:hypothetical protein EZ449_21600 [Pedobacter frigidisoli]|uniref:Uncharacterized protein n=1 Tax=Pedobacter frigidisoli TaxID=2530455 RepID=A0A4R0NCZ4_9SPHI|nr:hypothetical protein [Pedobacter frigidisoli]TCC98118.1 hypothetical protein EZ449_21600 [Pedobacter frigidisoli]
MLPLGDFSLIRDIPDMYRNYTHIASPDELSVADFIGDYLLHGKEIFGNNKQDKAQDNNNNVQFKHEASSLNIVLSDPYFCLLSPSRICPSYTNFGHLSFTSDFHDELLRPPLG